MSLPSGYRWLASETAPKMLIEALKNFDGTMIFVSHDRHFLSELSNRVLELTPEGPLPYGGGYVEYVQRTGREAPGLH